MTTMNERPRGMNMAKQIAGRSGLWAILTWATSVAALADAAQESAALVPAAIQATASTPTPSTVVARRLQSLYPSTHFGLVNTTPWPGVYEVLMGANIAYVDESGQYFLFGHFYDMQAQRDVTAEHKDTLARIDFDTLPLTDAIKEIRGSGKRVLAIFSDPDCPYCKRLENNLRDLDDITLYTFLMPIAALHPTAHDKAVAVWCAKDRVNAWHGTMWQDQQLPHAECPHPVDRNIALGERLGIVGTPTLVAADGRILPGAAGREQVEAWLAKGTASAQTGAPSTVLPR